MADLKSFISDFFCKRGLQEASSVEVKFKSGETLTIHSDDHPALGRDAEEVESLTPRQTAEGGN